MQSGYKMAVRKTLRMSRGHHVILDDK